MAFVLPIEELLKEVSPTKPCGVLNDVNEAQISVLDDAVKRAPEIGFHNLRKVAEGLFRGGEIADLASDKEGATIKIKEPFKHLKSAMVLTLAGLETEGLAGFSDGLILIEKLLSTQWDNVHPQANSDDPEDPYARRVNILSPLAVIDPKKSIIQVGPLMSSDSWSMDQRLFATVLLESDRHGAMNLRDAISPWAGFRDVALPRGEDRSADFVYEVRLGSIAMLPRQQEAVQSAIEALDIVEHIFDGVVGNFKPKFGYLRKILEIAQQVLGGSMGAVASEVADKPTAPKGSKRNSVVNPSGPVSSREEAIRKLTDVADYFRRHEPSSPVPLMIDRVKRLVGADFMKLLEDLDLGDETLAGFRKLAGIRGTENEAEPEEKITSETKKRT